MNRLKSIWITLATTVSFGLTAHAVYLAATTDATLTWAGAALANGAFQAQMALIMSRYSPRTSSNLPVLLVATAAGAGLAAYGLAREGLSPVALAYTAAGVLIAVTYVFWYSRLGRTPSKALEVGATLPDVAFEEHDGTEVRTADLLGDGPLILMFYRGNWCPFCMAQIRELAGQYRELEARGVTLALVSPQSHENTERIADRFDIPARFLADPEGRAARALGIIHEGGLPVGLEALGYDSDTVFPTVVITDAEGTVLFADQTDNYRVRPEPATFFAVLDGEDPQTVIAPEGTAPAPG